MYTFCRLKTAKRRISKDGWGERNHMGQEIHGAMHKFSHLTMIFITQNSLKQRTLSRNLSEKVRPHPVQSWESAVSVYGSPSSRLWKNESWRLRRHLKSASTNSFWKPAMNWTWMNDPMSSNTKLKHVQTAERGSRNTGVGCRPAMWKTGLTGLTQVSIIKVKIPELVLNKMNPPSIRSKIVLSYAMICYDSMMLFSPKGMLLWEYGPFLGVHSFFWTRSEAGASPRHRNLPREVISDLIG